MQPGHGRRLSSSRGEDNKTGVVPFLRCRGHCNPLWAVFPPLQVVLSFACSVASLSRCPSHYLPGHHHFRGGDLADYPFGWGSPSTWLAARTELRDTPSVISGGNREFEVPNTNPGQAPQNFVFRTVWIPFGDHPLKLERYRED